MTNWRAGRRVEVLARWWIASLSGTVELTTGSPVFRAFVVDQTSGARQYDQGNGTLGSTPYNFPFPAHTAGVGWRKDYLVPATMASRDLTFEMVHPDHPVPILETGWVANHDEDDLDAKIPNLLGEVQFIGTQPVRL